MAEIEILLRAQAPLVLGALVRRHGHFDACEDAVQEALLAAATQWPTEGVPDNPRGWLITVAGRRLTDLLRAESSRRRREITAASQDPPVEAPPDQDDTLTLLLLCCHPTLSATSQIALTLRAVGGLTTAEIAHAFMVPESTMAQRISRAKQRLKTIDAPFALPPAPERLPLALHALYLIFNEGYTTTSGPALERADLTNEAIRLTRQVHNRLPTDGEVAGLLALMLLTEARRPARTDPDGSLVPLADQDRTRWHPEPIREGVELVSKALANTTLGPYQIQAAIAAIHDEAADARDTDWRQILGLYQLLTQVAPSPMVTLNQAVAVGMVHGPQAGLALLTTLDTDNRMARHHRLAAVRAHLLDMAGDHTAAREQYLLAAKRTTSVPERRYLEGKAALPNNQQ